MKDEDIAEVMNRMHNRLLAHEHVLRQLITKTASHSGRPRDAWTLELRREIAEAVRAYAQLPSKIQAGSYPTEEVLAEIDRIVKVSDL